MPPFNSSNSCKWKSRDAGQSAAGQAKRVHRPNAMYPSVFYQLPPLSRVVIILHCLNPILTGFGKNAFKGSYNLFSHNLKQLRACLNFVRHCFESSFRGCFSIFMRSIAGYATNKKWKNRPERSSKEAEKIQTDSELIPWKLLFLTSWWYIPSSTSHYDLPLREYVWMNS